MTEAGNELFDDLCHQLDAKQKIAAVSQMDILNLPPPLDSTLTRIIRQGSITVSEFANDLHLAPEQGRHLVKILVDKGYLYTTSAGQQTICKVHFAQKRKKRVPTDVWDSLDY